MSEAADTLLRATCRCGKFELEAELPEIAHISCYCDDCQAAAEMIDALEGGCSGIEADGGTPNLMLRRDRVRFVRGEELLVAYQVREGSPTFRLVASCCNTAITQRHDNWFPHRSVKSHLFTTPIPPMEMRVFTRYAPNPDEIPRDAKRSRGTPARLAWRIMKAVLATRGKPRSKI